MDFCCDGKHTQSKKVRRLFIIDIDCEEHEIMQNEKVVLIGYQVA